MARYIPQVGVDAIDAVVFILEGVYTDNATPPTLCHYPSAPDASMVVLWQDQVGHVLTVHREHIAHSCEDSQVTRLWLTDYQFEDAGKCLSAVLSYRTLYDAASRNWPAE